MKSVLLGTRVLATWHHDNLSCRMSRVRTRVALLGDGADDSTEKVPRGIDLAPARQRLTRGV